MFSSFKNNEHRQKISELVLPMFLSSCVLKRKLYKKNCSATSYNTQWMMNNGITSISFFCWFENHTTICFFLCVSSGAFRIKMLSSIQKTNEEK